MDYSNLDAEEQARRKKEEILYRTKKRNSRILLFAGIVFEIIETVIIFFALLIVSIFIFSRILPPGVGGTVISLIYIADLIGSMFLGFKLYKAIIRHIIKRYRLEDKLTDEVIRQYAKTVKEEIQEQREITHKR